MIRFITSCAIKSGSINVVRPDSICKTIDFNPDNLKTYNDQNALCETLERTFGKLLNDGKINIANGKFMATAFYDILLGEKISEIEFITECDPSSDWPKEHDVTVENLTKLCNELVSSVMISFIDKLNTESGIVIDKIELDLESMRTEETVLYLRTDIIAWFNKSRFCNISRGRTNSDGTRQYDDFRGSINSYEIKDEFHETPFDDIMIKFNNELEKICSSKIDRFIGAPSMYILPNTGGPEFASRLLYALYKNNMSLSLWAESIFGVDFLSHGSRYNPLSNDACKFRPLICQIKYSKSDGRFLDRDRSSNEVRPSTLNYFFSNARFLANLSGSAVIFLTDDKETEAAILGAARANGVHCRGLLPDVITSRKLCITFLNKLAREDKFKKFTGELKEGIYTYIELQNIYIEWKANYVYNAVYNNGKNKKLAKAVDSYDPLHELSHMIGLKDVKQTVKEIISQFKVQELLTQRGVTETKPCRHMIFYGNPGTAKTTVARLIGKILKRDGILPKGTFVEAGRDQLVAEYVGQTAVKTKQKIIEAKGGILFIDEAYSLVEEKGLYGAECINTLVNEMENVKDDTIIIFAGYPEKMKGFLNMNEGLRSRIGCHVKFENYSEDELMEILELMCKDKKFSFTDGAKKIAREEIAKHIDDKDFGNGRFVRNIIERSMMKQSVRIVSRDESYKTLSTKDLTTIHSYDMVEMSNLDDEERKTVGFRK